MILVAAAVTIFKAVDGLLHHSQVERQALVVGIVLTAFALVVNGVLGLFLVRLGRKNSSITLEADGWHLLTDAITSSVALLTITLLLITGIWWLDSLGAIVVSIYIGRTGIRLLARSAAGLLDEQDEQDTRTLEEILDAHCGPDGMQPAICSYHKLRHRHSGRYHWVDFHLVVPRHLNVDEGHRIASAIEYEIEQKLGEGNATAHIEPCLSDECGACGNTGAGAENKSKLE
jgi:cation diffusion facilitator family transporter